MERSEGNAKERRIRGRREREEEEEEMEEERCEVWEERKERIKEREFIHSLLDPLQFPK